MQKTRRVQAEREIAMASAAIEAIALLQHGALSWEQKSRFQRRAVRLEILRSMAVPSGELFIDMLENARMLAAEKLGDKVEEQQPLDMVLHCPKCGLQHVDKPDPISLWSNPPHRSHLCHSCAHVWRPADVPTNGVEAVLTKGHMDSPIPTKRVVTPLEVEDMWNELLNKDDRTSPSEYPDHVLITHAEFVEYIRRSNNPPGRMRYAEGAQNDAGQ